MEMQILLLKAMNENFEDEKLALATNIFVISNIGLCSFQITAFTPLHKSFSKRK